MPRHCPPDQKLLRRETHEGQTGGESVDNRAQSSHHAELANDARTTNVLTQPSRTAKS